MKYNCHMRLKTKIGRIELMSNFMSFGRLTRGAKSVTQLSDYVVLHPILTPGYRDGQ